MDADQLCLFSQGLPPLKVRDVVRTPEGWIGEVCQVWAGRDYYAVFAKSLPMSRPLPTFRRDELKLLGEDAREAVWG